jgi:hypothetical protein
MYALLISERSVCDATRPTRRGSLFPVCMKLNIIFTTKHQNLFICRRLLGHILTHLSLICGDEIILSFYNIQEPTTLSVEQKIWSSLLVMAASEFID